DWIRTPSQVLRADLEPGEVGDGDTGILRDLAHGLLVVLRIVLLEQRDLLEEGRHAALHDLRQRRLRLALVAGDLGDDLTLLLHVGRGDILAGQVGGVGERDVLRDAASGLRVVTGVGDDDTDLRRQVLAGAVKVDRQSVTGDRAHATQLDLLADDGSLIRDELLDGLVAG